MMVRAISTHHAGIITNDHAMSKPDRLTSRYSTVGFTSHAHPYNPARSGTRMSIMADNQEST